MALTKAEYDSDLARQWLDYMGLVATDLVEFVRYMKSSGEKDFAFDPVIAHHLIIYAYLQRFAEGEFDNLMILMPPGAGKSVLCTVQFPLWYWAKNPMHQILAASNTQDLAEVFSGRRRSCALSSEYKRLQLHLTKENLKSLENNHGGVMSCHGVEGSVVGRRANLIMLDDPVLGSEQAESEEQLNKQMRWYDQDFRSRKVLGAKELIVTTRWSRRDIAGRLLARVERGEEEWTVLRLPLVCDSDEDPVGRKKGEILWPEEFDSKRVKHAKRDPTIFQTMYQQLPYIQDGDWVGEDHIVLRKGNPDISNMRLVIGGDLALTQGGGRDFTVFAVCGIENGGLMHILHIERNRHIPSDSVKTLFNLCLQYPQARELLLDDDAASKVFKELLLTELKHSKHNFSLVPIMVPTKGLKKESRAVNLRSLFHQKRVIIWNKEFAPVLIKEIIGFPDGVKHDDQVDALALVAKRAVKYGGFGDALKEDKDPFEGMMLTDKRDEHGRQVSNMTINALVNDQPSQKLSLLRHRI